MACLDPEATDRGADMARTDNAKLLNLFSPQGREIAFRGAGKSGLISAPHRCFF
jgi:hypothetical protein